MSGRTRLSQPERRQRELREMIQQELERLIRCGDTPPRERLKALEMLERLTHGNADAQQEALTVRVEVTDDQ